MTDSVALREWIQRHGLKYNAIAAIIGITQKKIDNETEFKASEIATFVNDLGMSKSTRDKIFFAAM